MNQPGVITIWSASQPKKKNIYSFYVQGYAQQIAYFYEGAI